MKNIPLTHNKGEKMRTSNENPNNRLFKPSVVFYYMVCGVDDGHGRRTVERTLVRTNRKDALICFNKMELETFKVHSELTRQRNHREYVSLFEVSGQTKYGLPSFKHKLLKTRLSSL